MLTYSFEHIGSDSLYEYLYKCIRQDILTGKIRAGEKLPSKRSFARNLGVSTITVENAYAQLMAEGYLYSLPKSGYYAAEIGSSLLTPANHKKTQAKKPGFFPHTAKTIDGAGTKKQSAGEGERETAEGREQYGGERIDLSSSRMNQKQFPFSLWAKLMRQVLSGRQEELMLPSPGAGVFELRGAIAGYLRQYQGMDVRADQIIVGAGTEYLYGLLIQLLGQDKIYALEDPGYVKIGKVYRSHLVKTAYIPMDESGVQIGHLRESGAQIMHISPSHHYPTGITMPIGRRYELLSWALEQENRFIIEDDYDCEFRLTGRPIPSLQSIDREGKVIYMNTFTKSLASTIRISYMVLPERLLEQFQERLGFCACTVSNFEQYTLAEFIRGGYFEKHINRMRNYYRNKRDELLSVIAESPLAGMVKIHEADAGLHFLMLVDTGLSDEELISRAREQGIRISCLSGYYNGTAVEGRRHHEVIINYSWLEPEQMRQVAEKLYIAWDDGSQPGNPFCGKADGKEDAPEEGRRETR